MATNSIFDTLTRVRRAARKQLRLREPRARGVARLRVAAGQGVAFAQPASPTRAGLSTVLLLYFLGVILVITLAPFRFRIPKSYVVDFSGGAFDILANVLLFLPLGFLYPLTRRPADEPSPLQVVLLGCLLSSAIEITQFFIPGRYTSVIDVLTNTAGAGLGALAVRFIARRVRVNARHVGLLSLEIPLIGLIYLLVPLVVVTSLGAVRDPIRLVALVPLLFAGARLMSAVQRNHFAPAGLVSGGEIAVAAGVWTVLGVFPVLASHPWIAAALVFGTSCVTWLESSRRLLGGSVERRFETAALSAAAPLLAAFLLAMICLPLDGHLEAWHFRMGLTGASDDIDGQMVQLLAPVATLTVLGYLLAEARGRREQSFRATAARIAAECGCIAIVMELSRGFQKDAGASGVQLLLTIAAGLLGAAIYHSQREHVRWILLHRPR